MPRYYADKIYTLAEKIQIAEYLERKQSENFFVEILKDESIIRGMLLIQKNIERKAFEQKPSML